MISRPSHKPRRRLIKSLSTGLRTQSGGCQVTDKRSLLGLQVIHFGSTSVRTRDKQQRSVAALVGLTILFRSSSARESGHGQ